MKISITILVQLISLTIFAQSLTIDLSQNIDTVNKTTILSNSTFEIFIENKIPDEVYEISFTKKAIPIDKLELPAEINTDVQAAAGIRGDCTDLMTEVNKIYAITDEAKISPFIKDLRKKINDAKRIIIAGELIDDGCVKKHIDLAEEIVNSSKTKIWEDNLKRGEQLEVIITRKTTTGIRTWKQIYSTEPRGSWQVSYGFSFITQLFSKESIYYSASIDSAYSITKENNRKIMDFVPSIFFTWIPSETINKSCNVGFSGGLGFDLNKPTVFLGPTISINQNLNVHLGVVAHSQYVLLGKYEATQLINENLSKEQLHEELYRINPFISVSFRFNQNPFNK